MTTFIDTTPATVRAFVTIAANSAHLDDTRGRGGRDWPEIGRYQVEAAAQVCAAALDVTPERLSELMVGFTTPPYLLSERQDWISSVTDLLLGHATRPVGV
jgi:hypothetical protein